MWSEAFPHWYDQPPPSRARHTPDIPPTLHNLLSTLNLERCQLYNSAFEKLRRAHRHAPTTQSTLSPAAAGIPRPLSSEQVQVRRRLRLDFGVLGSTGTSGAGYLGQHSSPRAALRQLAGVTGTAHGLAHACNAAALATEVQTAAAGSQRSPPTCSASAIAKRAGALSSSVSAGHAPVQRSGGLATGLRLPCWAPLAACLTCGHARSLPLLKHIARTSLLSAHRPLPPRAPTTQPRPSCTQLVDMPSDQSTRVSLMAPGQSVRASAPVKVWNNVAFESRLGEDIEDDTRATALAAQAAARSGGAGWANSEPHNARTSTPGSELRHSVTAAWGSPRPRSPRFFPGQEGVPSPIGHRTSQTGTHRLSQTGSAMPSPSSRVSAAGSEIYPLGQLFTHNSGTASPTNGWTCAEEVASREGSVNSCNNRCGLGIWQWGGWSSPFDSSNWVEPGLRGHSSSFLPHAST